MICDDRNPEESNVASSWNVVMSLNVDSLIDNVEVIVALGEDISDVVIKELNSFETVKRKSDRCPLIEKGEHSGGNEMEIETSSREE